MTEFKINEHLSLKLEERKTNIYVNGKLFNQCKFLLLNISVEKVSQFDEIESVDEIADKLEKEMETKHGKVYDISPESEFWAHCSNLQVWAEQNYDTRLIHSNLAFPLLNKLTKSGDLIAKRVFREEIAKRIKNGFMSVVNYLIENDYIKYLNKEELLTSLLIDENEISAIYEIEESINEELKLVTEFGTEQHASYIAKDKHVIGLYFSCVNIEIPEVIENLLYLEKLWFDNNLNLDLPKSLKNLNFLKELIIINSKFNNLPDSVWKLNSLKVLRLEKLELSNISKNIHLLRNLEELYLGGNKLKELPYSIGSLKSLKRLWLNDNKLTSIPETIGNLISLEELYLRNNKLTKIPDIIGNLKNLKILDLTDNKLDELPRSLLRISSLSTLYVLNNQISNLSDFKLILDKSDS